MQSAAELGRLLAGAESDSVRRFVAVEALVMKATPPISPYGAAVSPDPERAAARQTLDQIAQSGPPLARLAAQIGRSFLQAAPADLHPFIERLLGG
jgi:hypothetical protein